MKINHESMELLMIKIENLREEDIGRWVTYTTGHGTTERGRIKSWNDMFIFVVYNCDGEWKNYQDYTAAATDPNDLTFG